MIEIVIVIALIALIIKNNDLTKENNQLKSELNKPKSQINFCPKCGYSLNLTPNIKSKSQEQIQNNKEVSEKKEVLSQQNIPPLIKKKQYNEKEIKNTTILSVGAILVILSAIVFLATTWNTSINTTKTLIIALMFFVFLGSSYIADKYLKIKQTSKIFLYIAFSYLPLVFFSISLFELLGYYLSFFGPGKYIYLALSTIVLSVIYYYFMIKKKDIFFAIGSIIFQVLSVILFLLIFTSNINIILIGISIYTIVLNILYTYKKYYYNESTHLKIKQTLIIATLVVTFYLTFILKEFSSIDKPYILLLISLYFNIYYLLAADLKTKGYFKIVSPILILFITFNMATIIKEEFIVYQSMIIIGIIINYLKELLYDKKISIENYVINSIALLVVYLYTFTQDISIPSYCLLFVYIIMTIYQKSIKDNSILDYIIPTAINIEILNIVLIYNINVIILPIIYILIFIISTLIKEKQISKNFKEISILFTIIAFTINIYNNINYISLMITSIIITLIYYIYYLKKQEILFKYIAYSWLIVACYYIIYTINPSLENLVYVFTLSSIITFVLDKILSPESHNQYEFLMTEFIIIFILLPYLQSIFGIIIYLIIAIFYYLHNVKWNKSVYLSIIPIVSFNLYLINNNVIHMFNYYAVLSYIIPIVLLIYLFISEKKEYIVISLISIILSIILFPQNIYIITTCLLLCAFSYYIRDKERKNIYLSSIYILITILLKSIIHDLNLESITVINIGVYIIPLLLITRTILKEKSSDYKIMEYIGLVIIYSLAIIKYTDELDGMLFVLLLLILSIISYYKKLGPVFLTSLIYILINVFILTRVFWLSLPWWIYILIVGSTLIAFAIRNELSEKNKKESKIKEVAKKIDL